MTVTTNVEAVRNELRESTRRIEGLIVNTLSQRTQWLKQFLDPRRSIADECGYPEGIIEPELYQRLYEREPVAKRVVELYPKEGWKLQPSIYEDEDADEVTEFEERWDAIGKQLRGERSYYKSEQGSVIWEKVKTADIVSGIGQFGIILIGIDDGLELSQPANGVDVFDSPGFGTERAYFNDIYGTGLRDSDPSSYRDESNTPIGPTGKRRKTDGKADRRILFMRTIPESMVQVVQIETNPLNPRFGHPIRYLVNLIETNSQPIGVGLPLTTLYVHWTRVVHLADTWHQACSNEWFAYPRQQPVLNPLLDIQKVRGGSAEMYWRGAFPGLSIESHPQLGGDVNLAGEGVADEIRDEIEQYQNTLQRYLLTVGMTAKSLAPQVVDPTPQIAVQIEAICIAMGCPVRIFKGSERGELASTQDEDANNERVDERRQNYQTPRIAIPLVDRLIDLRVLPVPTKGQDGKDKGKDKNKNGLNGQTGKNGKVPMPKENGKVAPVRDGDKVSAVTNVRTVQRIVPVRNKESGKIEGWNEFEDTVIETDGGYTIKWPDITSGGATEKADIALTKARTIGTFVQQGGEAAMSLLDFYTEVMGMEEEKAQTIVDNATEDQDDHLTEDWGNTGGDVQFDEDGNPIDPEEGGGGDNPFGGKDGNGNDGNSDSSDNDNPFSVNRQYVQSELSQAINALVEYGSFLCNIGEEDVCVNCGGEGGKPGPCPEGKKPGRIASAVGSAVLAIKHGVAEFARHTPTTITPSGASSQAMTSIIQELSGQHRGLSMAAASIVLGITPYALIGARRGINWLRGRLDTIAKEGSAKKGNKEQRTKQAHKARKANK